MKKNLNSIMAASLFAVLTVASFIGCAGTNDVEIELSATNTISRSVIEDVKTLSSDLNPGYGKAVFFTGEFNEGKEWTVAVRGTYEDGHWTCNVTSDKDSFEYKALIGDWDQGETVEAIFEGLKELGRTSVMMDYNTTPSGLYFCRGEFANYGEAIYFKRDLDSYAVRAEYKDKYRFGYKIYVENGWIYKFGWQNGPFFDDDTIVYVGPYDLGEKIYPTFVNLTWESGENHIYQ